MTGPRLALPLISNSYSKNEIRAISTFKIQRFMETSQLLYRVDRLIFQSRARSQHHLLEKLKNSDQG